jgi:hypothetical protein
MPVRSRQDAERRLAKVPDEHVFRCCDGCIMRDMQELGEAFVAMTDETFTFHSNSERKDFRNWVRDIIGDEKLARDLGKSLNQTQAANRVAERIAFLSSKLSTGDS